MDVNNFLFSLILLLFLGRFLGLIFTRYKFQSLIGEVLAGVVLSPLILGALYPSETLQVFAQFGIIMIMLLSGLLTDFTAFSEHKYKSILIGVLGVIFSIILIFAVLQFFGIDFTASLFISVILSNTAVEVCATILMKSRSSKEIQAIIMGASFVDDIVAVFLIGVVGSLTLGAEITLSSIIVLSLGVIAFLAIFLIGVPILLEKYSVIDKLIGSGPQREKVLLTFTILFTLLLGLIAQYVGLQVVIGAYIAGLIIGKWGSKVGPMLRRRVAYDELVEDIQPISHALFTPLFFGYIGLTLGEVLSQFGFTLEMLVLVFVLTFTALLGKWIGCGLGSTLSRIDRKSAGFIGIAMGGRGALELVLLALGYEKEIISGPLFASVVLVTLLTVILTPLALSLYEKKVRPFP
jgi:Kef-type K+ transport system membrane component KefB